MHTYTEHAYIHIASSRELGSSARRIAWKQQTRSLSVSRAYLPSSSAAAAAAAAGAGAVSAASTAASFATMPLSLLRFRLGEMQFFSPGSSSPVVPLYFPTRPAVCPTAHRPTAPVAAPPASLGEHRCTGGRAGSGLRRILC